MRRWTAVMMAVALVAGAVAPAGAGGLGFDGQGHFVVKGAPRFVLGTYDTGIGPFDTADQAEAAIFTTGGNIRTTRALQNLPLNVYLNYHRGADSAAQINALMDALGRHEVLWLQTSNCYSSTSYTTPGFATEQSGFIDAIKMHPQLAGYYIMDECDDFLIPETQAHHASLGGVQPQDGPGAAEAATTTFAVPIADPARDPGPWTAPASGGPTASFFGTDPYTIYGSDKGTGGYAHFEVADHIARLRSRVPKSDPVVGVLQFFKFGGGGRLPTLEEMRMHAYSAIVEGATGLFWWEIGVNGLRKSTTKDADIVRMMGYLERLTKEIAGIEPGLMAPADHTLVSIAGDTHDPVAWRKTALQRDMDLTARLSYATNQWYYAELTELNSGSLRLSPMLHDPETTDTSLASLRADAQSHDVRVRASVDAAGRGYVVAYNYGNATVPVTFQWNGGTISRIDVVGEGRTLSGTSFKDTFAPYQAHVYVITPVITP
jgi:hypothetical protein